MSKIRISLPAALRHTGSQENANQHNGQPARAAIDPNLPEADRVVAALHTVFDPELPVNLYDLGLIYNIICQEEAIEITMTLTAPNCPVADKIPQDVQRAVACVTTKPVHVTLVWEPKWTKDRMSDAAKLELGLL